MRALAPLFLVVGVMACGDRRKPEFGAYEERKAAGGTTVRIEHKTSSRVIDQARKLTLPERERIDGQAARVGRTINRTVLVLTAPPLGSETLEHFGWAINGQRQDGGTVMVLVSPDQRRVRVDSGGSVTPEQAAAVAAAMQPALREDKVASAIHTGLATLEQFVGADAG